MYAVLITGLCTCFSSIGNHSVAIVKGKESFDVLKNSLLHLFDSVNTLIEQKTIRVCGQDIPVEIFLGGDYKVKPHHIIMFGEKNV